MIKDTKTKPKIRIKSFPAKNGDSFLIQYDGYNILIDCGYKDTFESFIKPELEKIKEEGEILNRLIITHLDQDHIQGAIYFLRANINNEKSEIIKIDEIWHNSYKHLKQDVEEKELTHIEKRLLKSLKPILVENTESENQISAKQSISLSALISEGKYKWNEDFNGKAISTEKKFITLSDEIKIHLLSPNQDKLDGLFNYWKTELRKIGLRKLTDDNLFDEAFEGLLLKEKVKIKTQQKKISSSKNTIDILLTNKFSEDTTETNGSSMAFILEIEDKKLLFLADAHPSIIMENLEKHNKENGPIIFDLIKIAHHGSFSNNDPKLLALINSPKYLISTNGSSHNHPDKETLAWIISTNNYDSKMIYFNYDNEGYKFLNNEELKKEYNYKISLTQNYIEIL